MHDKSSPTRREFIATTSAAAAAFTIVTRFAQQRGESIRTDRWRYTEWSDGQRELYDHFADPEECQNLAGQAGLAAIVKELRMRLMNP